jgi:transglutaminase-like putative cysteine protease
VTEPTDETPFRYRVRHLTTYAYGGEVVYSHQMVKVTPRSMPHQTTFSHELVVSPLPASVVQGMDAFGNPVMRLQIDSAHDQLRVEALMDVEVRERPARDAAQSQPWNELVTALRYSGTPLTDEQIEVRRYRHESPYVRIKQQYGDYASEYFTAGRPVLAAAEDLMHRIFADFTYVPGATTVNTPLAEVFEKRRGVCQDYSHVMIACLRSLGLSARYVSGYLRTAPVTAVDSAPELIGADASHAWVAVYAPPFGWVPLDPTNNRRVGRDHVTLTWGRDFGDVSPLRGVIQGGGEHTVTVNVAVMPQNP